MTDAETEEHDPNEGSMTKTILWYLTLIVGLSLVIFYWGVYIDLNELLARLEPTVPKIAVTLLTVFVVNLFIKLSRPVLRKAHKSRGGKFGDWKIVSNVYTYVVWVLTCLVIFIGVFGSLSSLGISIGIMGAGLAFALQEPILSFSGFFLIMLKRPFAIGDRVVLTKEGVTGDVENITLFFFVLKEVTAEESQTGKSIIVPNSAVFQGAIINYAYDTPYVWYSIPVSITYESDLELAEKLVYEAALNIVGKEMNKGARIIKRKTPDSVHADLISDKPVIRIEFADSSIDLNLRILCLPKQVRSFKTTIYRNIHHSFNLPENRDKVEIAYPHMEIVARGSIPHKDV